MAISYSLSVKVCKKMVVEGQQQEAEEVPVFVLFVVDIVVTAPCFVSTNPDEVPRTLVISKSAEIFFLAESTDKCLFL